MFKNFATRVTLEKVPRMSAVSGPSRNMEHSFHTLDYVMRSKNPSDGDPDVPALHELPRPHIDSFDSIFDDGLLDLAVSNLDRKEIVDATGNRLSCSMLYRDICTYSQFYSLVGRRSSG